MSYTKKGHINLNETTISSEEIYNGKVVTLRLDKVKLPNGKESTREIVAHRGAIAAVPLLQGGNVVMVRQFRQAAGEILLEIPAGSLEPDEDPKDCAIRELKEEIGYEPKSLIMMFKSYLAPGYSSEMLYTYLAQDLIKSQAIADEDEFLEVLEVPINDAVEMIVFGEIKDAKTICGILMAKRMLGEL
jgi:ADP-ribose pyrophosphatase